MTPRNMFHRNRADRLGGVRNAPRRTTVVLNLKAAGRKPRTAVNETRRFASLPRDSAARMPA